MNHAESLPPPPPPFFFGLRLRLILGTREYWILFWPRSSLQSTLAVGSGDALLPDLYKLHNSLLVAYRSGNTLNGEGGGRGGHPHILDKKGFLLTKPKSCNLWLQLIGFTA